MKQFVDIPKMKETEKLRQGESRRMKTIESGKGVRE